jgi:hypothetical protein
MAGSLNALMAVAFGKSKSSAFPLALSVAQGASKYCEGMVGGQLVHVAIFSRTPDDARRAAALLKYSESWKGFQIFVGGRLLRRIWDFTGVLECYLEAVACNDYRAHCHRIIDDPSMTLERSGGGLVISLEPKKRKQKTLAVDQYVFPCSHLLPNCRFTNAHPSALVDQVQAAAVKANCEVCPHFDHLAFTKIGTRLVTVEAD